MYIKFSTKRPVRYHTIVNMCKYITFLSHQHVDAISLGVWTLYVTNSLETVPVNQMSLAKSVILANKASTRTTPAASKAVYHATVT